MVNWSLNKRFKIFQKKFLPIIINTKVRIQHRFKIKNTIKERSQKKGKCKLFNLPEIQEMQQSPNFLLKLYLWGRGDGPFRSPGYATGCNAYVFPLFSVIIYLVVAKKFYVK